jgi:uncharacterized protein
MPADPLSPAAFDASIVDLLACPVCYGDLRLDISHLICAHCQRTYPIVDGIPVLTVDESEPAAESRG